MNYPIAETFKSIQGEGSFVGQPQLFIRMAGCNVGKYERFPFPPSQLPIMLYKDVKLITDDHPKYAICESVLGERFVCDTLYQKTLSLTQDAIIEMAGDIKDICVTGGEPFLHDLVPLLEHASDNGYRVHIETSGTLKIKVPPSTDTWITCAPKKGFLHTNIRLIDEYKLLVSPYEDADVVSKILDFAKSVPDNIPIYLCPINGVTDVNNDSLHMAKALVLEYPRFRLGLQLHKIIGVQ